MRYYSFILSISDLLGLDILIEGAPLFSRSKSREPEPTRSFFVVEGPLYYLFMYMRKVYSYLISRYLIAYFASLSRCWYCAHSNSTFLKFKLSSLYSFICFSSSCCDFYIWSLYNSISSLKSWFNFRELLSLFYNFSLSIRISYS